MHFPSSCVPNAAGANTCWEYSGAGFSPGLRGGTAVLGQLRHTLRRHKEEERHSLQVLHPQHTQDWTEAGNTPGHHLGNDRNQMFPSPALCKPCTSLRVQTGRYLQFGLNGIYLDLLHLYQEGSVCGSCWYPLYLPALLGLSFLVPQDPALLVKATLLRIKECIWSGCFSHPIELNFSSPNSILMSQYFMQAK